MSQLWDNDITDSQRPYVMELQDYLRRIQRERNGTTTVPLDGFYGADTAEAVRQFQIDEGLSATGIVDYKTWEMIFAGNQAIVEQQMPPLTIRGLRQTTLQYGDQGDSVQFLNIMLGIADTIYTDATIQAVKDIQEASFLPITGNTDKRTWDAITALYNQGGAE